MKGVFFNEDNLKYNLNVCMTTGVILWKMTQERG